MRARTPRHGRASAGLLIAAVIAWPGQQAAPAGGTRYSQLRYVPESDDPSLTLETKELIVKVLDNTGLLTPPVQSISYINGTHRILPYSHHLGYHGIRTLYNKTERRNVVVPFVSWLNLQGFKLEGIPNDPTDERAWAGVGRGWPMRVERKERGALLIADPLPSTQTRYTMEFQPVEPDTIDFNVTFRIARRPDAGPARLSATWPCYMNAYEDTRFYYPRGTAEKWEWTGIGEKPTFVVGEPVNYQHDQKYFPADEQAFPVGYGRIGEYALVIMFDDPRVKFYVVNGGGHLFFSPVQNPAWDFSWTLDDYPVGQPVGFKGRLVYTRFKSREDVLARYHAWARPR